MDRHSLWGGNGGVQSVCDWKAVEVATAAERAAMRFFKVTVEVP